MSAFPPLAQSVLSSSPPESPTPPPISCIGYSPKHGASTLRGFGDFHIRPWHLRLLGCSCHRRGQDRWMHLPSRVLIDKTGQALRDDDGKFRYEAALQFDDKDTHR